MRLDLHIGKEEDDAVTERALAGRRMIREAKGSVVEETHKTTGILGAMEAA